MDRTRDVALAKRLSVISVALGAVVGALAVVLGAGSGSLSMIGFGVDAGIDATASVVLVWRFTVESRDADQALRAERLAERLIGIVLLIAAAGLVLGAIRALVLRDDVHGGTAQLLLLAVSLLALPPLALAKRRVAIRLGSNALKKDALLTGAAAVLAAVALVAGQLAPSLGIWWADAAGSIVIAVVLGREGWLVLRAPD